jgi:hypothetical protein
MGGDAEPPHALVARHDEGFVVIALAAVERVLVVIRLTVSLDACQPHRAPAPRTVQGVARRY